MTTQRETFSFTPEQGVPPGLAPFSHATRWGDLPFVTDQMPTDPASGRLVEGGLLPQAEQVRRNLEAVLAQFGATLDDSLMVRVYLTDFTDYTAFSDACRNRFKAPLPSRACLGVTGLAVRALVEIDLTVGLRS
ncbi:RidA family protein [Rhodopila sp.]|uniref:RidA family protein n=1 Tax=Rhodopila sp. TaxID=2480087 RepID=UPI003D0C5EE4